MQFPRSIYCAFAAIVFLVCKNPSFAGQGAQRMLYTPPNMPFISAVSGDHAVIIADNSGSIASLQSSIATARANNPTNIIVITLLSNGVYLVSSAGLILDSRECLVAAGATLKAVNSSVTVPLVQINPGATNVSIAGGVFDGGGANIDAIYAPAASRVNVDKVIAQNCGQDCILLKGQGNSTYDNEMTVTRCDVSGSSSHAGISIQNSTQTAVLDNNCHDNSVGIYLSCAWADVANNTCESNSIGIQIAGGNDNVVANNTCNNNGTGISAGASNDMIVSSSLGNNLTAGINSSGSGNNFLNNLFNGGNAVNFISGGSGNNIIACKTNLSASGQNYFYPPLIDDQHTNTTIVNGMGRTDLTISSTTIDSVQSQYNSARSANPNNVIVLHLNGTFTVGATALTLQSNACVLLNGTIQINASTTASAAIQAGTSPRRVSISGGTIDGGNLTGNTGISFAGGSMIQVDSMTIVNFGSNASAISGSDAIHFPNGGSTPYMATRCLINGSAGRAIWSQLNAQKALYCDNTCLNTRAGIDCDSSTYGAVCMFNTCISNLYGIWYEQSASHNTSIGNICNNNSRYEFDSGNNAHTTPTEYNSYLCNTGMGDTGITTGAVGTNTFTSHNFDFNNVIVNASITSDGVGTNNYFSQNYQAGGSLTVAGSDAYFNSAGVSSNLFLQDGSSGLVLLAQNAGTANGTPIVIGSASGLDNDKWALIPTDSGYYRLTNKKSRSVMAVNGASLIAGAGIVEWTFGSAKNDQWMPMSAGNGLYYFVNRLSGMCLDVPGGASGTQLVQQPYAGAANQQFNLPLLAPGAAAQQPFSLLVTPSSQAVLAGQSNSFTITIATNSNFTGSVNLNVSGLPANTASTFSPVSLSGSGTSTLSIATVTNTPVGIYFLTITATGNSLTNAAPAGLTVNNTATALPGTLLWTAAGGSGINWPTALNWTNVTTPGYGPPGISNDVVFTNIAVATASNLVDNIANISTAINSLTFNNTNGFHTIQIADGAMLSIVGSKGLTVGTELDLGNNAVVYASMTGAGGALVVSNTSANVLVRQTTGGASGPPFRSTLDLSGLDNLTVVGNSIEVGTSSAGSGTVRSAGTLYLARTNLLNLSIRAQGATTNAGIDLGDNPNANSSQTSFIYLGQQNSIYTDGITVGGGRDTGLMLFNAALANPAVFIRGTNGDNSRVSRWLIGDNSGATGTGSNSRGTNDFTGGTVDALVDTMIIGRGESGSVGSGNSTGALIFEAGTIDVNSLQMGLQAAGATGAATSGTGGTNYFGEVNVNGTALLVVNSNLLMTVTNGGNIGAMSLTAMLNVNGGVVQATDIVGGSGTSTINLNSGAMDLQGGQITNITSLNIGDGISSAAQLVNGAEIMSPNPIVIAANGTLAGNSAVITPNLVVDGTITPGVAGTGAITASASLAFGAGGNFVAAVQDANGAPASGWDFVQAAGQLNIASTAGNPFTIHVRSFANGQIDTITNFSADTNYDWTVAAAGSIANFDPAKFAIDTSFFENDLEGGFFYIHTNNNSLILSFTNNHPPVATASVLYLPPVGMAIPISNLTSNWSDADGDPVVLADVNDFSTNGIVVNSDGNFIYYTNGNNVADALFYTVQDVRTDPPAVYRNGDTQRTATGEIIFIPPPVIGNLLINGNSLIFNGAGGKAGGTCYLLTSTNVAFPIGQWQPIATNLFNASGNLILTNGFNPNLMQQRFYMLEAQ
jgi:parallel beta-helix repeat protein